MGAIKLLALKERGNEYWVAICASGLTDKCLRDVAEQPVIAASIGRELEPQDSFVSQLDVLWSKMHQVRLFDAEAQAHEEDLTTDQERSRVVQVDERFQTFRLLTKEKQTGNVAGAKGSNAAQCELYSDVDYDCPYELVTLEEALRQFDESRKAILASGNHESLTAPEKGYKLVPTPETLMWNNEAAERSSVLHVRFGEVVVQRLWVESDGKINVQMDYNDCPERGLMESEIVRLNHEEAAADFEQMSAERTTLSSEGCSFTLEARMELSPRTDETWEVENAHCTTQAVECNFKAIEELADIKLECVKQGNLDCMCAPKTEAERPWHGNQTFVVEAEPQWNPRPSTEVAKTAYQRVPDRNAGIKLTEASSARRKRKVWTSFLWFMTALWVQVNVLSDCGKSLPLKGLPRCPNGWDNALWPSYVNWGRAASLLCEEDWVQHRQCLSPVCRWKATKWREGKMSHSFEQSDRSWIRQKGNPGVELMLLNTDGDAKTSVLIVDMENNHSEVNEKSGEVSRVNPRGQTLEGKSLRKPSREMFIKLSRTCPRHQRHDTKMASARELREASCESLNGQTSEGHREAWNSADDRFPPKCPTMSDGHRAARKFTIEEKHVGMTRTQVNLMKSARRWQLQKGSGGES